MQDFTRRGGKIEYRRIEEGDIAPLVARFDLLVVSTGKGAARPALHLSARTHALFAAATAAVCRSLHGRQATRSHERHAVGFSGTWRDDRHPDRNLRRCRHRAADGERAGRRYGGTGHARLRRQPQAFPAALLGKLEKHHPTTYDRIDTARFDLAQPQDFLQGGVVPTVRNTMSSSTTANAPSRWATCIRSSTR